VALRASSVALRVIFIIVSIHFIIKENSFPFSQKSPDKNKDPQCNGPSSEQIDQEYQECGSRISPRSDDGGQKVDKQPANDR